MDYGLLQIIPNVAIVKMYFWNVINALERPSYQTEVKKWACFFKLILHLHYLLTFADRSWTPSCDSAESPPGGLHSSHPG